MISVKNRESQKYDALVLQLAVAVCHSKNFIYRPRLVCLGLYYYPLSWFVLLSTPEND